MSDLINPKLLARVERSLRKRVKNDVLPHLLRCAAHAHNEDEFIASAGRLLLNVRERQQWLAVWATRLQGENADPLAADLDSTTSPGTLESLAVPADLEATPAVPSADATPRFHPTPVQLDAARTALARELGPIANMLMERELPRATSAADLVDRIEAHLDETQRMRFRDAAVRAFGGS